MRFFGIDLAFSPKNGSGICVLEERGLFVREEYLCSDQDIIEFVSREAHPDGNVIMIDAPVICVNERGQRPCETLVGKAYGKYHANALSSNTNNMAGQRGPELLRRLKAKSPVSASHDAQRAAPNSWPVVETYPHPGHIELFKLSKILKYKKGKVHDRKIELSRYCSLSFRVLSSYSVWMTPMGTEDGCTVSAVRWLERNCPSVPMETLIANRDRRSQRLFRPFAT
jgi:predicted RNase H-like nuclease